MDFNFKFNWNQENKNRVISGSIVAGLLAIAIVICCVLGYDPPDPPIPEEGVEVNLGNSDFGSGDNPMPTPAEASSAPRPQSATEHVSTQKVDHTTPVPTSPTPSTSKTDNPTPTTTKPETPKEPEIIEKAMYPGKTKQSSQQGGGEGKTYGSGNQGKPDGDPNSKRNDGTAGKGGAGWKLKLDGRTSVELPSPTYNTDKEGKVVVKIWVDRNGNVTQVSAPEKGSTISEQSMVNQAKAAAMKAKFSSSANAPEVQVGTITYTFVKQ